MTTDVCTAQAGEPVEAIRTRLVSSPHREGLAIVFLVDEDGRPLGRLDPHDLLAGHTEPREARPVPVDLPVERVIDLFALYDVLALPVVDADGRLIGSVTIEDVLEELVAERLPGRHRYAGIQRRVRRRRASPRRDRSHAPP